MNQYENWITYYINEPNDFELEFFERIKVGFIEIRESQNKFISIYSNPTDNFRLIYYSNNSSETISNRIDNIISPKISLYRNFSVTSK